jgi:flavin reductase (DIM6/NTAB) family NADH-FMN oxidoreductase RutF
MFYEPSKGHGLPHDPSKAIVSPRPVGWISTMSASGDLNLSPYSFFNMFASNPFLVWFSSDGEKDSVAFARETGEFVVNLAGRDLVSKMVASSVDSPRGVSEFGYAGLTPEPSRLVKPPRVKEALAAMECKVTEIMTPRTWSGAECSAIVVAGEVIGVHVDDSVLVDGRFDAVKAGNVARLGYFDYLTVDAMFEMRRPRWKAD